MVVKFMFQRIFGLVTLAEIQNTTARKVARSHSSRILSFDLIGQHQNKRFYVMGIVLLLWFTDAIFRRERSNDRKCVCCLQATPKKAKLRIEDIVTWMEAFSVYSLV